MKLSRKSVILAKEAKDHGVLTDDARVDSVLVAGKKLACAEVGGDHGGQTLVDSGVEKVVNAGNGELV